MSVDAVDQRSHGERIRPTGDQRIITHGDQQVAITEVGAGLRTYTVGDWSVLDGFDAGERCTGGRGQTLIPWPNRIRDGRYRWALGPATPEDWQLDLSEPARRTAIHGLTRWAPWRLLELEASRAMLGYVLHPCPGWPFSLRCTIEYVLDVDGLAVHTTATNVGEHACPYGTGAHPYLAAGTATVDSMFVRVPAAVHLLVDGTGIPCGRAAIDGPSVDLRSGDIVGARQLDVTYTDLRRDADGRARVRVVRPDERGVALWLDDAYGYVQLFTGDTLDDRRRRRGLAVEPMTCPPDAFNSGESLVVLQPSETHRASWGIEPDGG